MSSLRNAVQRRNHRERDQPEERKKWGLLEKRKDYKLRATDHKTKQRKINALKQKASERNEDEFYFGMVNARTAGGIKRAKRGEENSGGGGKALSVEVVKLMKTQDRGYLQTMLQRCRKEKERVEKDVLAGKVGVEVGLRREKVVFGEDGEEVRLSQSGAAALEDDDDDDDDMDMDLDGLDDVDGIDGEGDVEQDSESEHEDLTPGEKAARRRKRHALEAKRRKLQTLTEQEEKLSAALDEVDHQRAKMNGGIGGINKKGVKFKNKQRKR